MFSQDKCMCVCNTFFKYLCATFSTRVHHRMRIIGEGDRPWLPRAADIGSSTTRRTPVPTAGAADRPRERGVRKRSSVSFTRTRTVSPSYPIFRILAPRGSASMEGPDDRGSRHPLRRLRGSRTCTPGRVDTSHGPSSARHPLSSPGRVERSGTGTGRWCVPRCLEGPCNALAWHASSSSRPFITSTWRRWPPKPRRRRDPCPLQSHRPRASRRPPPLCPYPPPSC